MQTLKVENGKAAPLRDRSKLASAGTIVQVVALIGVIIILAIGLDVLYNVQNNIPSTSLSSAQQTGLNNLVTSMVGAFQLAGIIPIVMVAGIVISAFFLFFAFGVGRGGGGGGGGQ
jgi:ABC-type multidrug transport system permease subunit